MSLHDFSMFQSQFRGLSPHVRLVLLHPNFFPQHPLLAELNATSLYVPLRGKSMGRDGILMQVAEALGDQKVETISDIFLDEADRALDADLLAAVHELLALYSSARVTVLLRVLPKLFTQDAGLMAISAMLPHSTEHMLWNYADATSGKVLEVRALGPGRVQVEGRNVSDWDGHLPRNLFFYFVDRGTVTRNEIFETFWPDMKTNEATNVFHVTKRKINELMGTNVTVYDSGFYRIAPQMNVQYDVMLFEQLMTRAAASAPEDAYTIYQRALGLYRGDYLGMAPMPWIQRRASHLQALVVEALIQLSKLNTLRDEIVHALASALRAFGVMPHREDVALQAMQMSAQQGHKEQAQRIFSVLRHALHQRGMSPSDQVMTTARTLGLA